MRGAIKTSNRGLKRRKISLTTIIHDMSLFPYFCTSFCFFTFESQYDNMDDTSIYFVETFAIFYVACLVGELTFSCMDTDPCALFSPFFFVETFAIFGPYMSTLVSITIFQYIWSMILGLLYGSSLIKTERTECTNMYAC